MASPAAPTISSGSSSLLGGSNTAGSSALIPPNLSTNTAQFREIHKNTWLKRLTADGKKITVGPKKSERNWVVFCVHDDTEALLEGYAEPRQAASHSPEWIVSMQDTLHISHALIPNSHEFEFVVTLSNEVVRFHAMSWEIMQEWVETLRSKLREMKILSPRENLYTKLPEIRAPLLPTRDPTSPLPAPPPVPAALVPGVERVVPQSTLQAATSSTNDVNDPVRVAYLSTPTTTTLTTSLISSTSAINGNNNIVNPPQVSTTSASSSAPPVAAFYTTTTNAPLLTSMSNTLTQNLLNMLSDPISTYSEQLNDEASTENIILADNDDDIAVDNDESFSIKDINLADFNNEFLSPLLRKSSAQIPPGISATANSVRVDIGSGNRASADQIKILENLMQCERLIPRPQTSRSLSAGAVDKSRKESTKSESHKKDSSNILTTSSHNNITELEISSVASINDPATTTTTAADSNTNITIIQVSTNTNTKNEADPPQLPLKNTTAEIFKFPETHTAAAATTSKIKQHEYKSNVQIIPSNINNSTIQVLGQNNVAAVANQYSTPVKKIPASSSLNTSTVHETHLKNQKITTVHVAGNTTAMSMYGTCFTNTPTTPASQSSTPKMPKKIILSANTSGITNIAVNNACSDTHAPHTPEMIRQNCTANAVGDSFASVRHNAGNVHYEKVFLSSSIPITLEASTTTASTSMTTVLTPTPMSPTLAVQKNTSRTQPFAAICTSPPTASQTNVETTNINSTSPTEPTKDTKTQNATAKIANSANNHSKSTQSAFAAAPTVGGTSSPAMQRRHIGSPTNLRTNQTALSSSSQPPLPMRPSFLRRGLTEAVITTRPSRKDFHFFKITPVKQKPQSVNNSKHVTPTSNNNEETPSTSNSGNLPQHAAINRTNTESLEQRRRSSSTSDAQAQRSVRGTNNNEFNGSRVVGGSSALRIQQPPQPFRIVENGVGSGGGRAGGVSPPTTTTTNSPAAKRLTLREQQVMQLRREIMHPGGVRLQLRRKDCVGSIAWVDAFGAVWVAGWKQKEHPVLYNALHIGDQLLSIAGVTINSSAEANKIIRNANTLFVEVLVRRIPFGRCYAIRREREGQCLGLIRDGNTSTIVDVVPNSLAARHGLPPKAQSCDGTTLTFWVLTEINGRPLNLFFKENEIRDRLNSVGRDISILVQPSDLVIKLKKQLKSLRGHKDYLVQ